MNISKNDKKNRFDVPFVKVGNKSGEEEQKKSFVLLPDSLLLKNAQWFCNLRWILIGILLGGSMSDLIAPALHGFAIKPTTEWAFGVSILLILFNLTYLRHIKWMNRVKEYKGINTNLNFQIGLDLIILTGVVHYVGSLETYIAFAYLFHIVLACIFFPGLHSLGVTIFACILYVSCVIAETKGIITTGGIVADSGIRSTLAGTPAILYFNVASAVGIWLVVWYLTSHLSSMVRERDHQLVLTNVRLKNAQEERTKHLLRTTHELKAPFAAIDANIQLIFKGHCGVLPDKALEVLDRIFVRSRRLGHEIQEMLQLANLRTVNNNFISQVDLDLMELMQWCKAQVSPMADKKEIVFEENLQSAVITAVEDHMKMMLVNLFTNAVNYSNQKGLIRVMCKNGSSGGPVVTIEDNGIGIPESKLPRIFEEYYRTDEAVRVNKSSTGLGLAIVNHVAQKNKIKIRVESEFGVGTKITLRFPKSGHYSEVEN